MKFCKDCQFMSDNEYCKHKYSEQVNLITGELEGRFTCKQCRNDPTLCGFDARWFEAKL